jgi:hypothetical protein
MQRSRKPETRHVYSARWVKAYVEAITNDRPVTLLNRDKNKTYQAHMAMYEQLTLPMEGISL